MPGLDFERIVRTTPYVKRSGDTMTGFLSLVADPVSALHAATKQYVDAVAGGGGGGSTLTTRGDLLTRDAGSLVRLAIGAAGRFLRSDGTDPSWQALVAGDIPSLDASKITTGTFSAALIPSTVPLAGDVTGTLGAAVVAKINGVALGTTTATSGNILVASGGQWTSRTMAGDATMSGAGNLALASVNTGVGTFGDATNVPQITADVKGRVLAITNVPITPAASSITGGAALTKVDDTNVTLTLGGTPSSALLAAASITVVWAGTLGVARGGTAIASYAVGDVLYASGATTLSKLAGDATTTRKFLRSPATGALGAPVWDTLTAADIPSLSQYLALAGREGSTNNPTISTGMRGVIYGSAVNGGSLHLYASAVPGAVSRFGGTGADAKGLFRAALDNYVATPTSCIAALTRDQLTFRGNVHVFQIGAPSNTILLLDDPKSDPTAAAAYNNPEFDGFVSGDGQTLLYGKDGRVDESFIWVGHAMVIKPSDATGNPTSATRSLGPIFLAAGTPFITADTGTLQLNMVDGLVHNPIFQAVRGGVGSWTGDQAVRGLHVLGQVTAAGWTVPKWYGLHMSKPTITAGGITTLAGVFLDDLAGTGITNPWSLVSLGSTTHMLHAGKVRIGDTTTAPTRQLEILSTGVGSVSDLVIDNTTTQTAGHSVITLGPAGMTVGSGGSLTALSFSPTATISATTPAATGLASLFNNQSTFVNGSGVAVASKFVIALSNNMTFRVDGSAGGSFALTEAANIPTATGLYHNPKYDRLTVGSGTGTATSSAAVYAAGNVGAGWTVTNFHTTKTADPTVGGAITNQVAHDVGALTKGGTLIVAYQSAIAAAAGRYFLRDTGGAQSLIKGKVRIGDNTDPTLQLEVGVGAITGNMDTMTYANPMTLDVTLGNLHKTTTVNATGNATVNASTAGSAGQHIWVLITNDATSVKTITFGTNFKSTGTITTTAVSKSAVVHFVSDGTSWYEVARATNL